MTDWTPDDVKRFQQDVNTRVFSQITSSATEVRSKILIAGGYLEAIVEYLIKKHCKNSKKMVDGGEVYTYAVRLAILNEISVIPDDIYRILEKHRKIRNKAAHRIFFEEEDFIAAMGPNYKLPEGHSVYLEILTPVMLLWNEHTNDLVFEFSPVFLDLVTRKKSE